MKKLVLMAAAIVAVSFASCGNKAVSNAEGEAADTLAVVAAEEVAVEEVADTVVVDSIVAEVAEAAE